MVMDRLLSLSLPSKMSLTHYFLNDYSTPVDRFFDDMFSNRAYRQSQQLDGFRPR